MTRHISMSVMEDGAITGSGGRSAIEAREGVRKEERRLGGRGKGEPSPQGWQYRAHATCHVCLQQPAPPNNFQTFEVWKLSMADRNFKSGTGLQAARNGPSHVMRPAAEYGRHVPSSGPAGPGAPFSPPDRLP
eukprot:7977-Hanusia_phi.AAC.5